MSIEFTINRRTYTAFSGDWFREENGEITFMPINSIKSNLKMGEIMYERPILTKVAWEKIKPTATIVKEIPGVTYYSI